LIKEKFHIIPEKQIGKLFSRFPFKPNFYSVLSLFFGILGFISSYFNNIYLALLFFSLSGFLDLIDGALARYIRKETAYGAFLDGGVVDRLNDFFIIFSFVFFGLPNYIIKFEYLIVILVYFTLMPTFIVAYANHRKLVNDPNETKIWRIMHRGEMYVLFLIALFLIMINKTYSTYLLTLITILNIITTVQTIYLSFKHRINQ